MASGELDEDKARKEGRIWQESTHGLRGVHACFPSKMFPSFMRCFQFQVRGVSFQRGKRELSRGKRESK
jgi:hypothetical protein